MVTAALAQRTYDLARLETDHPRMYTERWVLALGVRASLVPGASMRLEVSARYRAAKGGRIVETWVLTMPPSVSVADIDRVRHSTPDKTVTEEAALVVALAQVAEEHDLAFDEVTLAGEHGDYWLKTRDGQPAGLLEVSGTNDSQRSVEALFAEKRTQVLSNRSPRRCYVSVTAFPGAEGVCCCVRG
ncbi:MAG: hypothetical protein KF773_24765 [Deltaproteobacteria bacterium]|nr:hypothetical protein [Deltaproteobacteria bacterium]